ncbi:MAG: hypothetical protein E7167_00625 [Firmicutes bacterium]|nr:hypothetical protein [Bacillota bacterium]
MMKKAMLYLLVLGLLLVAPFSVNATTSASISNTPVESKKSEDGTTVQKTYEVYITTTENESLDTVDFGFKYGVAITNFECADAGEFVVEDQTATAENALTCKFSVPNEGSASGQKILVGKVVVTAKMDAPDADCTIEYVYEGATGKINPPTGVNVPYTIIAGGIVIAAGVYFVTKRRTKLYKI